MENATKALLMAAGVLLGILLLSVMIYVFRQGSRVQQTYDQKQITNQLELYNSKFEQYDRDTNNIIDVISLVNLAFDINSETDYDISNAVEIIVGVGTKKVRMPNTPEHNIKRNEILLDNSVTSIYKLVNSKLSDLGISIDGDDTGKLTESRLDKTTGQTIYKYLFKVEKPEDFEYHFENMRVSRIKLKAYINPKY